MSGRDLLKLSARVVAALLVVPSVCSFRVRSRLIGGDRALEGSTQLLGLIPGLVGQYLRRAFLMRAIAYCAPTAAIEFGTTFSATGAQVHDRAYIGPRCQIGLARIERDVLIAAGVHVPSGRHLHGTADLHIPIRDQPGRSQMVQIGSGSWIGSAAVVMADVGANTIIGAGAVVTSAVPAAVIAGGVPARVLRARESADVLDLVAARP